MQVLLRGQAGLMAVKADIRNRSHMESDVGCEAFDFLILFRQRIRSGAGIGFSLGIVKIQSPSGTFRDLRDDLAGTEQAGSSFHGRTRPVPGQGIGETVQVFDTIGKKPSVRQPNLVQRRQTARQHLKSHQIDRVLITQSLFSVLFRQFIKITAVDLKIQHGGIAGLVNAVPEGNPVLCQIFPY